YSVYMSYYCNSRLYSTCDRRSNVGASYLSINLDKLLVCAFKPLDAVALDALTDTDCFQALPSFPIRTSYPLHPGRLLRAKKASSKNDEK
ncbi:hypothetical protein, partial [Enterobacter cloacae complex sp. 4DZ3-17B2]|uniref:hypothetical protein n=1 Tax=Enterobacter cloacae complex sp. 4DZ3-17B2 TaxID=2511990 RepID=UPI001CA51B48